MEDVAIDRGFWRGKRVFLTGHTGFKGGWLALWLADMGAEVHGYALTPPTDPNFYTVCSLRPRLATSRIADIRDVASLQEAMRAANPEIVFHLAAQPLVRQSYATPQETYAVNVMGTVNVFEAVRKIPGTRAVVNITTDKCYENREWVWPYRENDPLGGHDPYSSSKSCSELITASYRRSYFASTQVGLASARAGNVIGGGDWATDRVVPDFFRSVESPSKTLNIRSPLSIRPWQHVLEPLYGYLLLAQGLYVEGSNFADAWNFGPDESDIRPVRWLIEHLCAKIPGVVVHYDVATQLHEATSLRLDSSKARLKLGWSPRWALETALDRTLDWHKALKGGAEMQQASIGQIKDYEAGRLSA